MTVTNFLNKEKRPKEQKGDAKACLNQLNAKSNRLRLGVWCGCVLVVARFLRRALCCLVIPHTGLVFMCIVPSAAVVVAQFVDPKETQ